MQVDLTLPTVRVQELNTESTHRDYAENVVWQVIEDTYFYIYSWVSPFTCLVT